ncbi:MAG: cation transporter [Candidatus Micrarchaeota archaeon]|nr:cation transporter [Candidatus Micrarchaeota archaeon]
MTPKVRHSSVKKALLAQYALLAYNLAEGILSVFFGSGAGSIALLSFGLDSFVETASTLIVTHRLRISGKVSEREEEEYEHRAFKWVGWAFILLAIYVAFESIRKLIAQEAPQASLAGILIAFASIAIMPRMAKYRHDIGHEIGSNSLVADSKQTMLCAYMSVALLFGIGLNLLFGWWWADPLAGLAIAALAFLEGKKALEGKTCC